jgi:NhaP-type Na+/H+ or K+/H+ antiporter
MYQTAAIIAGFLLVYTAVSGRVERSWLSGPVVFTVAGLILGPAALGLLRVDIAAAEVRVLAEGTLALVLFTDAANADFAVVRRNLALPGRLLLIGLPLTIVLGFVAALAVFPGLDPLAAALLATILAPTDAALGKPVVTNPAVDATVRESLNVESGLNDGICVPVVVILLELAVGTRVEGHTAASMLQVVAEELGIGLAVGLAATGCAILLLRAAVKLDWVSESWIEVPVVAVGVVCFAGAQAAGGSGFIACFVGGLMVSWLSPRRKHDLLRGAESIGETLAMLTWVAFGAVAVGQMIGRLSVSVLLYAVLSLTLVRMLPVFLCLSGTGMSAVSKLFIGWFGPRGLASIVFGVIVFNEQLPSNDTLEAAVVCTVMLSVLAHGVTANPLLTVLGARLRGSRETRLDAAPV